MATAPHLVQYQGSKRLLARQILSYMPRRFKRLIEPFSGVAAISIAAAFSQRAAFFHLNDINRPLVNLLECAIENPDKLISNYRLIWEEQFKFAAGHGEHFYYLRDKFNRGEVEPGIMLYLLARCVKGSVRYGKNGKFNQSLDKRRHGTKPDKMAKNIRAISALLGNRVELTALDYREIFALVRPGDVVYMDPPYQGVCANRDNRYAAGVKFEEFVTALAKLNDLDCEYLISYDGECGAKAYGSGLPEDLNCKKIMLDAGVSTQATLLGRRERTLEALYVSNGLYKLYNKN